MSDYDGHTEEDDLMQALQRSIDKAMADNRARAEARDGKRLSDVYEDINALELAAQFDAGWFDGIEVKMMSIGGSIFSNPRDTANWPTITNCKMHDRGTNILISLAMPDDYTLRMLAPMNMPITLFYRRALRGH